MTLSRRENDDLDKVFDLLFSRTRGDEHASEEAAATTPEESVAPDEPELRAPPFPMPPLSIPNAPTRLVAALATGHAARAARFHAALAAALSVRAHVIPIPIEDSPLTRAVAFAAAEHVIWLDASADRVREARIYLGALRRGQPGARVVLVGDDDTRRAALGAFGAEDLDVFEAGPWSPGVPLAAEVLARIETAPPAPVTLAWALDLAALTAPLERR